MVLRSLWILLITSVVFGMFKKVRARRTLTSDWRTGSWMDVWWMTCNFTPYSPVYQSYQDDGKVIMKCYVQWSLVYD